MEDNTEGDGSWQSEGDQMIEAVLYGKKLHGGNFENLLVGDPDVARQVLKTILDEGLLDPPPASVQEFADMCEWNRPEHAADFVANYGNKSADAELRLGELFIRR